METIRLTESLSVDPASTDARAALATHLEELRDEAAEQGLANLEASLRAALDQLTEESFSPVSVLAVRVLAWRYEELAGMPGHSGTHPIVKETGPQGETLRSLVDDVTAEIRRGLLDSVQAGADTRLDEGKGTELLTPVWKAIAELRGLVAERSGGAIHFEDVAGVPLLTLSGIASPDALNDEVSLQGRRVLVADDDAEVRWFYVGVLREAGARVIEAADGLRALELARQEAPDLILADILMPRLDGLALCAVVRREPGLDGVPIVLLSWRDDFLHRMRELRAGAHDYLRKELPARQILDRVAAVLEPLTRFEEALAGGEEARGDLEELGVPVLFRAVRRLRPDTRVVLQDPWSLFEVKLSGGHIVDVARTAIDGAVTQGAPTLTPLAGMSSGRFVVAEPADSAEQHEGSLEEPLEAATKRLSGLVTVLGDAPDRRVELDPAVLTTYVRHSPKGVQRMIARLVDGESPRDLWESGGGSRAVVDALLVTLARQGAVLDVVVPDPPSEPPVAPPLSPATDAEQEVTETETHEEPEPQGDTLEREDFRAQWAVSMHREPVNRVSRFSDTIWRRKAGAGRADDEFLSGFATQLRLAPRVLGWSFAVIFCATAGFLLWREGVRGSEQVYGGAAVVAEAESAVDTVAERDRGTASGSLPGGLGGHAGRLEAGVDRSIVITEGQGVLELTGSETIAVHVDGVDRGLLPVALPLDEGRHVVRYRTDSAWTHRFYYVKAGATRVLRVSATPGGFVDAL